jgi:hypothetical protein
MVLKEAIGDLTLKVLISIGIIKTHRLRFIQQFWQLKMQFRKSIWPVDLKFMLIFMHIVPRGELSFMEIL